MCLKIYGTKLLAFVLRAFALAAAFRETFGIN